MSTYEQQQEKLRRLWQEYLSDENDENVFEPDATSEEFEPDEDSDSDSSDYSQPSKKKKKNLDK